MVVMEVGKGRDKASGNPVSSILMQVTRGRESLESKCFDASRQWRDARLFRAITGPATSPSRIAPHTEIERDSNAGFAVKRP